MGGLISVCIAGRLMAESLRMRQFWKLSADDVHLNESENKVEWSALAGIELLGHWFENIYWGRN